MTAGLMRTILRGGHFITNQLKAGRRLGDAAEGHLPYHKRKGHGDDHTDQGL